MKIIFKNKQTIVDEQNADSGSIIDTYYAMCQALSYVVLPHFLTFQGLSATI